MGATCPQLLDPQTVYNYNPNVGTDPNYRPTEAAARALDADGLACGLLHQTSGELYSFAVAQFTAESATRVQSDIAQVSTAVDGLPGEAYFRNDSGQGRIDVFVDDYWIVAESVAFFQARDAAGLIEGMVDALP